jgi:hypothetical protein
MLLKPVSLDIENLLYVTDFNITSPPEKGNKNAHEKTGSLGTRWMKII